MDKASALEFSVRFRKPFRFVDFDTKVLKRSFRKIGQKVQGMAKKNVSTRGVSKANEFPGMSTGKLRSSIKYRVSHSGFSVGVANYMTNSIRERGAYYPAFVYWGHRRPINMGMKRIRKIWRKFLMRHLSRGSYRDEACDDHFSS